MPRIKHVKAAKDYPAFGIAKGEMHYVTKMKTGPYSSRVMRQKEPFRRSQLTTSDYLGQLYDWEDSLAQLTSMEDAQDLADTIRALGEEQGEKFDNMPEGLQQGSTGELLGERRDACEVAAEEIEGIIEEWESARSQWETEIEEYQEELEEHEESQEAFDEWEAAGDENEPEPTVEAEPDLPDHTTEKEDGSFEFDETEWLDRVKEVTCDV